MVDIKFTVASVVKVPQNINVDVGGSSVPAIIEALEVELVSDHYGVLRLRFVGGEVAEAQETFAVDAKLTWTV